MNVVLVTDIGDYGKANFRQDFGGEDLGFAEFLDQLSDPGQR